MNRGRMIVLVMAIACAGLAMLLMRNMVNIPKTQTKVVNREVSKVHVLVAKSDIPLGGVLTPGQVKWQPWPGSAAAGYITKRRNPKAIKEYKDAIARVAIGAGDPIRAKKLVKADQGGVMAAILPTGMRALSVSVNKAQGVSGLILPNDHVDVVLTTKKKVNGENVSHSETLLRNVRVLAIGQEFTTKNGQKTLTGKTATLALLPGQVEAVTQAGTRGSIWLSLRSLADASKTGNEPKHKERSTSVKMLKFGVASQAFGVE